MITIYLLKGQLPVFVTWEPHLLSSWLFIVCLLFDKDEIRLSIHQVYYLENREYDGQHELTCHFSVAEFAHTETN